MGGICGWIRTSRGRLEGNREAMVRALAHRGPIAWLDGARDGPSVAIDSSFNSAPAAASVWSAWREEADAFASRLEGSFAVAALDQHRGRLVLARDRLGEKPLYYVAAPSGVAFASEIKALRAAGALLDLSLSPAALDSYLAFTYIPAPLTIYAHARKVPAGHCMSFDLADLAAGSPTAARTSRYWRLPDRAGEGAAPEEMLERLREALRRRLPSSGPVAAFLSGGLDSSVIVALLARERGPRVPTFSIGFKEADLDESVHARRVASLVGAEHHEILLEDVGPDLVSAVIDQLDEPMADAATIPTYVLAREASGCARVVMTGDGADALLAGDHWFRRLRRLDLLERLPRAARGLLPAAAALRGRRSYRRCRDLVSLLDLEPVTRYLRTREKWTWQERMNAYSEGFRALVDVTVAEGTYLLAPVDWRPGESVDAAVRLDLIHGLPEGLLMKADKAAMAHGVESRSPFLDQRLVEWAGRLEIGLLLRGSASKYLLKEAAASLLPRDLVHRRKQGFQVPLARWLKEPLRPLLEAAFSPELIRRQGIFDAAALGSLKTRFETGPASPALTGKIWQIVAFQTWWRRAIEQGVKETARKV